ncbi:YceI family protein [Mucisphaera sp.]|uniref:YceI family protein n=1 Tax=Mucisphaera sp. TaxID=2913024 RepID=UPI003D0BC541
MHRTLFTTAAALALATFTTPALAADTYELDTAHTAIVFNVDHAGRSFTWGRFNDIAGEFTIDEENPENSSFSFTVQAESIDTNNRRRDGHLRSADFFNVNRFPEITLNSTAVEPIEDGLRVTADLTLLGETREVTFDLTKMGEGEQRGQFYVGYDTQLTIQRSDFGMTYGLAGIGDDVNLHVSFEGAR